MRRNKFYTFILAIGLLMASCSTPSNITYFQNLSNGQIIESDQVLNIKIKPEDRLSIVVSCQDPSLSALFNLVQVQSQIRLSTTSTTNSMDTATGGSNQMSYYTVDPNGDIEFPVLGKIHIAGMSRHEISQFIKQRIESEDLAKEPIVTVEFVNTGISILGSVGSPGRYEFNKDHMTIIDAIAMAGDLAINGQREDVMVIRQLSEGREQAFFVNLTDATSLYSSPVFYLQQNDVIYVAPNDKTKRETTPNGNTPFTPSFWMSLGSFAITIATLIITLSK